MITAGELHARFRRLPETALEALLAPGTALILAPHQDDEALGCGGLIAACCAAGRAPLLAFLTDGCGSHPHSRAFPAERLRALREAEALSAAAALGLTAERVSFLRAPDTALARDQHRVAGALDALAAASGPVGTVLTTWGHDPHGDHETAAAIGAALAARLGARLLFYPVWGWTLPHDTLLPDPPWRGWRLPVGPQLARKQAAIAAHRSQRGEVITDDPAGFTLPHSLLENFAGPFEVFLAGDVA